ncbi:hypothetical protein ACFW1A_28655 [Kitasatospora sp. NPDC058965]
MAARWPDRRHLSRSLDHAVETVRAVETGGGDRQSGVGTVRLPKPLDSP